MKVLFVASMLMLTGCSAVLSCPENDPNPSATCQASQRADDNMQRGAENVITDTISSISRRISRSISNAVNF